MIDTSSVFESRVKIQQVVDKQLPEFVISENPLAIDFLQSYYTSQEYPGGPVDIAENLDLYLKLDRLTPDVISGMSTVTAGITSTSTEIFVTNTKGFPSEYGLIKLNDEIITYTGITTNSFTGCVRGFCGITSYHATNDPENLVFSTSEAASHASGVGVQNLSALFLKEFYNKLKKLYTPGLENTALASGLDVNNFIKEARSLYQAKGTEESIKILLKVLYGVDSKVIDLEQFLAKPSYAEYIRRDVIVAKLISGNPVNIEGTTLFQDAQILNGIGAASGPISEVEIFTRGTSEDIGVQTYYKISLFTGFDDESLIQGKFQIPGSSFTISGNNPGDSVITVDSTIGFPKSGSFKVGINTVTYTDKTITQFLGCSGITDVIDPRTEVLQDLQVYAFENNDLTKPVKFNITGVLSELNKDDDIFSSVEGSKISVRHLGEVVLNQEEDKTYKKVFFNSWIYNTSARYFVSSFSGSTFNLQSKIDRSSLKVGDFVDIVERSSQTIAASNLEVISINLTNNAVTLGAGNYSNVNANGFYDIRKRINTAVSVGASLSDGDNVLATDVLNTYVENNEYGYVTSNSLPSYTIRPVTTESQISVASTSSGSIQNYDSNTLSYDVISFQNAVPFVTGDEIFYQPADGVAPIIGLSTGSYFVFVEAPPNNNRIKLALSRSFLAVESYVKFNPTETGPHNFTLAEQRTSVIQPQKLLKKFPLSQDLRTGDRDLTQPGSTGMLINGVEIVNYKVDDSVFYGPLNRVEVFSGGSNYDAANPPRVIIDNPSVSTGTTALVQPVVTGSFDKILVDPVNFDIEEVLTIDITGGNGSDASATATLASEFREVFFNANTLAEGGGVDVSANTITFDTQHNFQTGDPIVYNALGNSGLGIATNSSNDAIQGLTLQTGNIYYSKFINSSTIQIHNTKLDAQLGINTIGITTENNAGLMKFRTTNKKLKIDSINILNPGQGYSNRKLIVQSTGINTSNNSINFNNHNFTNGDFVEYEFFDTAISGLSTTVQYKVLTVNNNSFRLANAGVGGTNLSDFNRGKFVDFKTVGVGSHIFKYPEITVTIRAVTTQQTEGTFTATPVVRGPIVDAYLYNAGTDYGSEILNFQRTPEINVESGKNAEVRPVILNGRITDVFVLSGGSGYTSPPELTVNSNPVGIATTGSGARLRALINSAGIVTSVVVLAQGLNYDKDTTTIKASSVGSGAILNGFVRRLGINKFAKINDNGGEVVTPTPDQGLEYAAIGYGQTLRNAFSDNGSFHSPIIGWAYDGNPIYGAYGYKNPESIQSGIKLVESGYNSSLSYITNRPNTTTFPLGFFVDDYRFVDNGDLDEFNGRFTITNEFPQGVYAYYATIDGSGNPEFPFFIGNSYRLSSISENVNPASSIDQNFDFNNSNLVRNTFPQKIGQQGASYDFAIEPYKVFSQDAIVDTVKSGSIDFISVASTGNARYAVGDLINFGQTEVGTGLAAEVSRIGGRSVVNIVSSEESYENTIVTWKDPNTVRVSIKPNFDLLDQDLVQISGLSTFVSGLTGSHKISAETPSARLVVGFGTTGVTGMTTDVTVSYIPISVGSSVKISNETFGVLNSFLSDGVLRLQRFTSESGVAHTATETVSFLPESFTVNLQTPYFSSSEQDQIYFNPFETVGIGTTAGISTTRSYQFNGITTNRSILAQNIYLPGHPFVTNQLISFSVGIGTTSIGLSTSPSGNIFWMPDQVYAVKTSKDTIGISTILNGDKVFFRDVSYTNLYDYKFESLFEQITADVKKITATVSTGETHGLSNGDGIVFSVRSGLTTGVGAGTSVVVKVIDDLLLVNPIAISSVGVNTSTSVITKTDHEFDTGNKVYYEASENIGGVSTGSHYVYVIDKDNFRLCETKSDVLSSPPIFITLTSVGGTDQTLSLVNPPLNVTRNNNLLFNLEHSSLSNYNLNVYYDDEFDNKVVSTGKTTSFLIAGFGTNGTVGAGLTVGFSSAFPSILYYNLDKGGYISTADKDVIGYNRIQYQNSAFNGSYSVSGIGSTTFNINLSSQPEKVSYLASECDAEYFTTSRTATGSIDKVNVIFGGVDYKQVPSISSITSGLGTDAVLRLNSNTIGKLDSVRLLTPGFSYPSDKTLTPTADIPNKLKVSNYQTLESVFVVSGGKNYLTPPSLVLYDPSSNQTVSDFQGSTELAGSAVSPTTVVDGVETSGIRIDRNPVGLKDDVVYSVVPVNNDNGVSIVSVASSTDNQVTLSISTPILGFTTAPFSTGDRIYVEGIGLASTTGDGHNSSDYGYQYFTITNYNSAVNPNQITYDLTSIVTTNTGIAETSPSLFANVVKAQDLAEFKANKKSSVFEAGELLYINGDTTVGSTNLVVSSFNALTGDLNITGTTPFEVGDTLTGSVTGSKCTVDLVSPSIGRFKIDSTSKFTKGWANDIGKLDEDYQVTGDNDYYQRMSYSIQSEKSFNDVISFVNDIVHPTGYRNFTDTQINPKGNVGLSFTTSQEEPFLVLDVFDGAKRVDTINDFDFVVDVDATSNTSKSVEFENVQVTDYILNKSNRVIAIDDISSQFLNSESDDLLDYKDVASFTDGRKTNKFLVQVTDITNDAQMGMKEIVMINNDTNTYLLEKVGLGETIGDIDGFFNADSNQYSLRFSPNEPYDTDYEVKLLQTYFAESATGIGSYSIGFVNLIAKTQNVSAGIGTTIFTFNKSDTDAIYTTIEIYDELSNRVDYSEVVLTHDTTDTYLTELAAFNSNVGLNGLSGPFIGSFTSAIDSDVVSLVYNNNGSNSVRVRTQTIGIGTTSAGIGTYRFKFSGTLDGFERTGRFESKFTQVTGGTPTVISGITSAVDSSLKSTVRVSIGETQSIHQVYVLNDQKDRENLYVLSYPFSSVNTETGIGTFSAEYNASTGVDLKFHPDFSGDIEVQSFNEILTRDLDANGDILGIGDLNYGDITQNVSQSVYYGMNQREILSFNAKHNGVDIFAKKFNPETAGVLSTTTGIFTLEHFFQSGETLEYRPGSNLPGIGATALVYFSGVSTERLPQTVYAIRDNASQFRVAISTANALAGTAVTFSDFGSGNEHVFAMAKRNEKSIINLNGVVQSPLLRTPLSEQTMHSIGVGVTIIQLSGISSIRPADVILVDNEYMKVNIVGLGSTNTAGVGAIGTLPIVEVERGFVGTSATAHNQFAAVSVYRGSFNIVDSVINFTEAPSGAGREDLDIRGLTIPRASFGGRVYLRKDYATNLLFDDVSDRFDGVTSEFTLTSAGTAVTGIGSTGGNGVVFINGIFQSPSTENNTDNNFSITEVSGISSIVFTGIISAGGSQIISPTDINLNQLPRGGVPISFGATNGLGYAALVPAKVIPTVTLGQLSSVSGVSTTGTFLGISAAAYDHVTGILTVTSSVDHELNTGDKIQLRNMTFSCPSGSPYHAVTQFPSEQGVNFSISSFVYDNRTGLATVGLTSAHNFRVGRLVHLSNIGFACSTPHGGITTSIFPDGSSGNLAVDTNKYPILGIAGTNKFLINVGVSTIAHTYVGSGSSAGNAYEVKPAGPYYATRILSDTTFETQVGIVTFAHTYTSGGTFAKWTDATFGSGYSTITAPAIAVTESGHTGTLAQITASVGAGGTLAFTVTNAGSGYTNPTIIIQDPSYSNLKVEGVSRLADGITTSTGIGMSVTVEVLGINTVYNTKPIVDFEYDASTGLSTVSVVGHGFTTGRIVKLNNLQFAPHAPVGSGGTIFPSIDAGFDYTVLQYVNENQFTINIGAATTVTTYTYASGTGGVVRTGVGATLFEVQRYNINNLGYSFRRGDVIRVVGMTTDPVAGEDFNEFQLTVENTFEDEFAAWQFGLLDYIDTIKPYQDGTRTRFPLAYNDQLISFEVDKNDPDSALINLESLLLVFVNGVLQEPNDSYVFNGGTSITFAEPLQPEDKVAIFFYRGSAIDSFLKNVTETVKVGDDIFLKRTPFIEKNDAILTFSNLSQESTRSITGITSSSEVETSLYKGNGVNTVEPKPIAWTKQKVDKVLSGEIVSKARDSLEAQIYPTAKVLKNVASTDTEIFVEDTSLFLGVDPTGDPDTNFGGLIVSGFSTAGIGSTTTVPTELVSGILNTNVQGYSGVITGITTSYARLEEFYPFDATKLIYRKGQNLVDGSKNDLKAIFIDPNGSRLYVADQNTLTITEWSLSTPFEIDTATINASNQIGISTQVQNIYDIFIRDDGTKLYTLGRGAQAPFVTQLNQFDLSVAWDLTSADIPGIETSTTVSNQTLTHRGLEIVDTGARVITISPTTATLYSYDLSTAYDITSIAFDTSQALTDDAAPSDFAMSTNGTQMIVLGGDSERIIEYTLSTGYAVTTVSVASTSTLSVGAGATISMTIKEDGERAYVLNSSGIGSQYHFSIPPDGLGFTFQLDLQDVPTLVERQQLVQGYRVLVFDTGVGTGLTTLVGSATSVGVGTTNSIGISTENIDNIYEVYYSQYSGTTGILTCFVAPDTNIVGIATTGTYFEPAGRVVWGRISNITRDSDPISIVVDGNDFEVGLTTYPTLQRRSTGLRDTGALSRK
jgi:hypothetical protein